MFSTLISVVSLYVDFWPCPAVLLCLTLKLAVFWRGKWPLFWTAHKKPHSSNMGKVLKHISQHYSNNFKFKNVVGDKSDSLQTWEPLFQMGSENMYKKVSKMCTQTYIYVLMTCQRELPKNLKCTVDLSQPFIIQHSYPCKALDAHLKSNSPALLSSPLSLSSAVNHYAKMLPKQTSACSLNEVSRHGLPGAANPAFSYLTLQQRIRPAVCKNRRDSR